MARFVPYEKLSKKKQRAANAEKRGKWAISPITRRPPNPKAYNRRKAQKWEDDPSSVPFSFIQRLRLLLLQICYSMPLL